jgi:hypothetical protein
MWLEKSLDDLPTEVLVLIFVLLQRKDLDILQLVCRRLNSIIRHCEHDRTWVQLARHTVALSLRAPNYKVRIDLKELHAYSHVCWRDLPLALRSTKVKVTHVHVRALNGPFQLHECEWMLYIRKIRAARKYWNRTIVNFEHLPLDGRITRAFMQQFLNASEIRFPYALNWVSMPDDFADELYDIILPTVTQLFVTHSYSANGDIDAWLRLKRPGGMRRFMVMFIAVLPSLLTKLI